MPRQRTLFRTTQRLRGERAEQFARLWAAYPHRPHDRRAPAEAAFLELVEQGVDAEAIIRGAEEFSRTLEDTRFLPWLKNWLAELGYRDHQPAEQTVIKAPPAPTSYHAALQRRLQPAVYAAWIAPLSIHEDRSTLILLAPTPAIRDHVATHLDGDLRAAFHGRDFQVVLSEQPHEP